MERRKRKEIRGREGAGRDVHGKKSVQSI